MGPAWFAAPGVRTPASSTLRREAKSVSAETTFDRDLSAVADLWERPLWRLCEKLARRLKEQNLAAGGVVLKLKTSASPC